MFVFSHPEILEYNNVRIGVGIEEVYPLKDYIQYEKRLIELVKPAMNLSPLEKYLYAYNIVKNYKEYKENEDDKEKSRRLYEILDGEFMVCSGYASMLKDLCSKLGLDAYRVGQKLDITFDKQPDDLEVIPNDLEASEGNHARVAVNIVDPKYNIDGIYFADPTWDNDLEKDTYNFALLSQQEYLGIYRTNYTRYNEVVDELLFSSSLEEFYTKTNIWIRKRINGNVEVDKELFESKTGLFKEHFKEFMSILKRVDPKNYEYYNLTYKNLYSMKIIASNTNRFLTRIKNVIDKNNNKELENSYEKLKQSYINAMVYSNNEETDYNEAKQKVLIELFDIIKILDPSKYNELIKYEYVFYNNFKLEEDLFREIILIVGEFIVDKFNKPIKGEVLISAIREMYSKTTNLTEEELNKKIEEIIKDNKENQIKYFPPRYKILQDGTKIPYLNQENKFDLETVDKKAI